jgi:hypothetical protein
MITADQNLLLLCLGAILFGLAMLLWLGRESRKLDKEFGASPDDL